MQQVRKEIFIDSIQLIERAIVVNLKNNWFQEDISQIQQVLLALDDSVEVKEKIIGADRETVRFVWQSQYYYLLNFDCYSQSCWFEPQDELSQNHLQKLFKLLQKNIKANESFME